MKELAYMLMGAWTALAVLAVWGAWHLWDDEDE